MKKAFLHRFLTSSLFIFLSYLFLHHPMSFASLVSHNWLQKHQNKFQSPFNIPNAIHFSFLAAMWAIYTLGYWICSNQFLFGFKGSSEAVKVNVSLLLAMSLKTIALGCKDVLNWDSLLFHRTESISICTFLKLHNKIRNLNIPSYSSLKTKKLNIPNSSTQPHIHFAWFRS